MSVQELVMTEIRSLSETSLLSLVDYVSFLKFQEEHGKRPGDAPNLEQLLAVMTPDNIHAEVSSGYSVGNEAW